MSPCCTWGHKGSWKYKIDDFSGLDPVQGASIDCYFMAALCSLAWTSPSTLKNPDGTGTIKVRFWSDPNDLTKFRNLTATVNDDLPVDDTTSYTLRGARSNSPDEVWPAIYEKLYANFLGIGCCDGVAGKPDICNQMPDGNPLFSLFQLTSWKQIAKLSTGYKDGDALFTDFSKNVVSSGKTKYPTVAWTYRDFDTSGTAIAPLHSYIVLGGYSLPGANYLVLRNPSGAVTRSKVAMVDTGAWTYTDTQYLQAAKPAALPAGWGSWPTIQRSFDLSIGLFALEANAFLKYFEGYGYIT